MLNRSLLSQKPTSLPKPSNQPKPINNPLQLTSNKISIRRCNSNQSLVRTRQQPPQQPVKVIPQKLHFQSTEVHQLYELQLYVRNESSEMQKVRIIPPIKKQFKIKFNETFNNEIAAGLAVKLSVLFCADDSFDLLEDRITVIGNSFKQEIPVLAEPPRSNFSFPKVMNIGTLAAKQQKTIQIPIKNTGSKAGLITIEDIKVNEYCPHISFPNKSITVLPGRTELLEINVKPVSIGELELKVNFSNMESCSIRAMVMEDQVEIVDSNGLKILTKDFGELFIGQKLAWPFFIANSTENQVDCILQTLNRKKEQTDIKIDKKRNIFIAETSPQQFSASVEASCFSLQSCQMQVRGFESQKNTIYVQKIPTNEQIAMFVENLTRNIESSIYKFDHPFQLNRNLVNSRDPNQIDYLLTGRSNKNNSFLPKNNASKILEKDRSVSETLAVKFSNQEKINKIPLKFFSKIPNLEIDLNVLQFRRVFIKESEHKQFVLKNLSNKIVRLNFNDSTAAFKENFKIEGPQILEPFIDTTFKIKFRPLIKRKFAQTLKIKVFDFFPIEIKIFGQCMGLEGSLLKNKMSMTMTDRRNELTGRSQSWKSLLKDRTARQVTDIGGELTMNRSINKLKHTQSSNLLMPNQMQSKIRKLERTEDQEVARMFFNLKQENMTDQKQTKESLFFKKEDFLSSVKRKKPFNHPSNIRELLRYQALTLEELKKIEVPEKKLEFGHIFVGSTTSKKLTITNKLQFPILVELDTQGAQSLTENGQEPIRIEGFGTYEANIVLHPIQLGELQLPLNYIINKQHVFEVKVLAMVTLVNLQLSSRSFVFNFSQDDGSFQKQQNLRVYNNGNKKTKFTFDQPENPSFKLSVLQGQLEPKSYMNIKIIYCPFNGRQSGEQRVDVQKLKMKVHEGAQNIIKCTGTVKQPKISIKQTEFVCQNCIISVPVTNKISVKNLSKVQTYIKVQFQPTSPNLKEEDISNLITIENNVYILSADEKKQIGFTFLCHQVKKFDISIVLSIRGYNIVKIPFSINMVYPQIVSLTPQINFQDVPIMSNYCIEMFHLVNATQTQIKLEIDPSYPKDEYFCEILAVKDKNLEVNYEDEKNKTFLNSFNAAFKDNKRLSRRKSIICNKVLTLPPNGQESVFNLRFVPKCIKKYDFQLPLRIFGCVEKVVRPVSLQVKCNAVDPVIYVEPRAIKFDTKVICETKSSYSQSLFISNPHNYLVRFRIELLMRNSQGMSFNKKNVSMGSTMNEKFRREDASFSSTQSGLQNFSFSQNEGQIEPNAKIQIFVIFKSTVEGEFLEKFNIFLGPKIEDSRSIPAALSSYILDVSGSAILPTLKFNCNQAIMPVVPLNLESRMFIMIDNHGYDAITICKWKTSNHFPHTEVKVNFIEGKLLSLAKKSLRVELIFSSIAPISFTTMLQFYDEYGNKYQLPLSCTADNSIFTSYPYLQSDNQHTILFNTDEKMIKIMPTGKNSYYDQGKQISGNHTMSCCFIQKWLNFQLNMSINAYPGSIVDSEGKEFVKLINRISSKNIIKKYEFNENLVGQEEDSVNQMPNNTDMGASMVNPKGKVTKILYLVELYAQTIKKLKHEGAFLNHIRPQFLLNFSQYVNYQNHKRRLVCSQAIFQVISVQTWISLFYQLCKIYVQPQITEKILLKMKIDNELFTNNLTSNLYSGVQIMLLKFVNFYLSSEEGSSSQHQSSVLVNFTEQIKIFEVIQKLLQSSFKLNLSEQINMLKNSVSIMSPHVFLSAIAKFLHNQLKEFGLSAYLSSIDLFTMGVKELVLYLVNLLQMIYHYSNATMVRFQGAVGDKITKVIELQNPTSKKVHYFVKIVNSQPLSTEKDNPKSNKHTDILNKSMMMSKTMSAFDQSAFIPQTSQVTIQPKEKAQLKVVYHCRNAKGQTANLYLIPTKEDDEYTIPQPLLFKLTTSILSKIMMKKVVVGTSLYEVLPIQLNIELPSQIPESAQFTLSLYQQAANNESPTFNQPFNPQSFIFSQSHARTLKQGSKDTLELKLVPLSMGDKICKISYFSPTYGEFIYEIHAKISNPKVLKEFRFKDLKVNVEEEVNLIINKQNDLMNGLLKLYYPDLYNYQCRTEKNLPVQGTKRNIVSSSKLNLSMIEKASPRDLKYEVQLMENQFVTLAKGCNSIQKLQKQNKIILETHFTKPFKEYSVLLVVRNQLLKDRRLYKVTFVVTSPPKIIKMSFKSPARQSITQKIPIKIAPCEVMLKTNCDCFSVQNFSRQYYTNTELICNFSPLWIQEKEAVIEVQNKESLEQIIYEISLKAEEPQKFGTFELVSSSLFNEEVSIPIDVGAIFNELQEEVKSTVGNNSSSLTSSKNNNSKSSYFEIKRLFKRQHSIQNDKFYPFLQLKSVKSFTGINSKSSQIFQSHMKQSTDKHKVQKTRTLIEEKALKTINMVFYPSEVDMETGSIRLTKPNSEEYYWAKVIIKNRPVKKLKPIQLQEKINHVKVENLDQLLFEQSIDFWSSDFQFKFSQQTSNLSFTFADVQNSSENSKIPSVNFGSKQKKPCLVFSPMKQTESEQTLYFKSNNREFMLPIELKADPMPTIVVPEITTINIEQKTTYLNLINGTQSAGMYKVVILNNDDDPTNQCWRFIQSEEKMDYVDCGEGKNPQGLTYSFKPKEKKEIKVSFMPRYIHQKQKFILKFESDTLPNYTYILNGRSQFKIQQEKAEFQVYEDNIKPFHVNFTNLFQRKEYFSIQLQHSGNKGQCSKIDDSIKVQDPVSKRFTLEQGEAKGILLSLRESFFKMSSEALFSNTENDDDASNFTFAVNIKVGEKVVKKYFLTLLIIKNLFSYHSKTLKSQNNQLITLKNRITLQIEADKQLSKNNSEKNRNFYLWSCKARQTIYETIVIPGEINFCVKEIKCPVQILKYITFTCISQNQESSQVLEKDQVHHLKIKYSPMKPIKKKKYDFILIGQKGQKYRIECQIAVDEPQIDDTIVIKTSEIDQAGCVSFKLTNTTKSSAKYRAYFLKKLPQFIIDPDHGILEGYGKPGTPIMVKFISHINNRRLEDKLIVETDDMYWCFRVKGMLSKDGH